MERFRIKILMSVVAIMLASQAVAQIFVPIYIPAAKKNNAVMGWGNDGKTMPWKDSYAASMLSWNERQLTWDDFKGLSIKRVANNAEEIMHLSLLSRPIVQKQKIGGVTYDYFQNESLLNTMGSWAADSCKSDEALRLAQMDFNLWELYSRRAIMEYSITPDVPLAEFYDFYCNRYHANVAEAKALTDNGKDVEKLNAYCDSIDREVESLQVDPVEIVSNLKDVSGLYYFVGLSNHYPFSDFVSSCNIGFNIGFGGFIKRHMIGMEVDFEAGSECKKNMKIRNHEITYGENLVAAGMNLQYGYRTIQRGMFEACPYLGVGARFYQGNRKNGSISNNDRKEAVGFSLGVGCYMNFALSRHVYIKTVDESVKRNVNGITVKPFLSFTNYNYNVGWIPAVNIAVDWNMAMFRMK